MYEIIIFLGQLDLTLYNLLIDSVSHRLLISQTSFRYSWLESMEARLTVSAIALFKNRGCVSGTTFIRCTVSGKSDTRQNVRLRIICVNFL